MKVKELMNTLACDSYEFKCRNEVGISVGPIKPVAEDEREEAIWDEHEPG